MKVLLTGGAGYLGITAAGALLDAGHEVRILDCLLHGGRPLLAILGRDRLDFRRGDIRDAEAVRDAALGMDAVVHLAAIVGDPACARQREVATEVNLDASSALLAAADRAGVQRFVFASTCSNYGRMSDTSGLADEDHPLAPLSLYAETKVAFERRLLSGEARVPSVTVLRFATLYGLAPRMRFDLTVNEFTMQLATRGALEVYGEQFFRPYVHVRDAARAIALVIDQPRGAAQPSVFNVGDTEENHAKRAVVDLVRAHLGKGEISFVAQPDDPRSYRVSFARIRERLGFRITRRVPDGIREVAAAVAAGALGDTSDPAFYNVPPRA